MTEKQLAELIELVVKNVIHLEQLAREIAATTTPRIREVYRQLIRQIQGLPVGSVERELAYKSMEDLLRNDFRIPSIELASELKAKMPEEALQQLKWASKYIQLDAGLVTPGVMAQMAVAAVEDVQVLNQAVEDITGPLTRSQWKRIDKTIRTGFLTGATNEQLARAVARTYKANLAERRAITRTAVMSLAQEAHNQFWDANDDVIVAWRWDASMDYRVCPVCAPLDGVEHEKRKAFKSMPPVHPNCRCHVVPVTEAMRATEKEDGEGDRSYITLEKKKPKETANTRVYKQKVRGKDGKMYWKVAHTAKQENGKALTMGEFIRRSNRETQASILGKGRAERFRKLIKGTEGSRSILSPEDALIRVTKS